MNNPFIYGQIAVGEYFCNRNELQKLNNAIQSGKSVYIHGPHKIGKTSLVFNSNFVKSKYIYFDFDKVKRKEDLMAYLISSLFVAEQKNSSQEELNKLFFKYKDHSPNLSIDGLGKVNITIKPNSKIDYTQFTNLFNSLENYGIIIDNIQKLYHINKNIAEQIISDLKQKQSIVIESSNNENQELFFYKKSVTSKFHQMELGEIDEELYFKFVKHSLIKNDIEITKEIFDRIINHTGIITSNRQLFFNQMFFLNKDKNITDLEVYETINDIVCRYEDFFEMIYNDLTDNQKALITKLAQDETGKMYSKQFCDELGVSSPNAIIKIIQSLINKKMIIKKGPNHLIFSPFFKVWLNLLEKQR